MGDGSVKLVGLSLAEQTFVFLLDRFAGSIFDNAHLSPWFQPGLLDLSRMILSVDLLAFFISFS